MRTLRIPVVGALALLIAFGVVSQASTYASHTHLKTKQITVREKSGKYLFSPTSVTVKTGTQVRWKNSTDAAHNIVSRSHNWSFNKPLAKGKTVALTFKKTGTYTYYCSIHPYMKGTIKVTM